MCIRDRPKIINEINKELKNIEKVSGKKFGDLKNPLAQEYPCQE